MFTGIVTAVGTIRRAESANGGRLLEIEAPYSDLSPGESIAVDGACLTVESTSPGWFAIRIVPTSLQRTLFGEYWPGRRVNLERALAIGDRLGGHMVQGHVDGVGRIVALNRIEDGWLVDLKVPAEVARVSVPLGSVTVDGVSLTVNALPMPETIQVSLVPFTLEHTTLGDRRPGDGVHLEGDLVGKYIRAFLGKSSELKQTGLSEQD